MDFPQENKLTHWPDLIIVKGDDYSRAFKKGIPA
jgi:hypothetical protein